MARLASPIQGIKSHYPVVVIGSGYGGGIAASRMARAGLQVCVLERGKEFQPGEYPDTEAQAMKESQVDFPDRLVGSSDGLYDFRVNDDVHVFLGCGLGGTSLVNANVAIRAEPRVFDDSVWPQEIRDDLSTLVEDGYGRAEEMLKPRPYPDHFPTLRKLEALERSATYLREEFYRVPINVTFEDGVNHVGVPQQACKLCGDCVSGCNYASKNTVLMNYLPDAKNHGAEIYTQVSVRRISRENGRWLVHYQLVNSGRGRFDAPTMFLSADMVFLAAGTLGSTEVLLRSKDAGLSLSDRLGDRFSGNGDTLGIGYNNDVVINGVGSGDRSPDEAEAVGPCSTGIIDARNQPVLADGVVIEEGAIPGGLSTLLPEALAGSAALVGEDTDRGLMGRFRELLRVLGSVLRRSRHNAIRNTQTYLGMAHDDGEGRIRLRDDRPRVDWRGVGSQPFAGRLNRMMKAATQALGGTYVKSPIFTKLFGHDLVTVHPLGGCVVAADAESGVVNHKGQVFSDTQGTAVYDGLYVSDGSIIPRPVGINPLLTISALAERCCALAAQDRGLVIDYDLPSTPSAQAEEPRLGVRFTEAMKGHLSTVVTDDYEAADQRGLEYGSPFEFILTIISDDLDNMLEEPEHSAGMVGSVSAPALSHKPLTATEGVFNLFPIDPERVDTRQMKYRMKLASEEGRVYLFEGFKVVRDDPGADLWSDTTTLFVTVRSGDGGSDEVVGKGILRIEPADLMRQLTTIRVTNARDGKENLAAKARFGRFFAGRLFDTYGGVFLSPTVLDADRPPRETRPLRVSGPEVYSFEATDGALLRLTSYQGGEKGPVILTHGLGVSSKIFSIDTIATNLLEYLCENEYDVWLLDYRASIDLPASIDQFTADDVATKDYPATIAKVREITGAESVQVVAHCFGSTTFFMAMLAGLEGVRSAVCSQVATHVRTPAATRVKAGLHLPDVLDALGVDRMTAYTDTDANWLEQLYDRALSLQPVEGEERCDNATCHRITFMYSLLYEHDQLNEPTHAALHEVFGVANMSALDHLSEMVRKGHLVAADGSDDYLPHLQRLAIPIAFVHGKENVCFLPESTEMTYDMLRENNGDDLYSRHVIPDYGHIDCIFGKNAAEDVYPIILDHLERHGT